MTARLALWTLAGTLWSLAGCSGGSDHAAPATTPAPDPAAPPAPLAIGPRGNEGLLGSVHVNIDPVAGTATVDPVRMNQAIGDAFLVGLNNIDHLCNCFRVQGVSTEPTPTGLRVSLRTTFDHPFSATQRPDLNGWDLKALVATDLGQQAFGAAGSASTGVLINADSYTEEWSDQIALAQPGLSSTMYPYIILGEDPTVSDPFDFQNPSGWNVFPAGGSNGGTFVLDIPFSQAFALDLFFTVGYQASATRLTRQTPDYQPPRGNSRSAWKVEVEVLTNDLDTDIGSTADLEIRMWDWHHGQSLGSDIASIAIHAPALMAAPLVPGLSGGTGRDTDPLTALATLTNELGTVADGTTYALVEVVDELHNNNPGGFGGDPGMTKIADDFFSPLPYDDVRTFQIVALEVESVVATTLQLVLDPIQNLVTNGQSGGEVFNDEFGAALVEEPFANVAVIYVPSYLVSATQRTSPGARAQWNGSSFNAGQIVNSVPSTGSPDWDWGYYLKTFSNWGGAQTPYWQFATHHTSHALLTNWSLGYECPYLNFFADPGDITYSGDFAVSRTNGRMYFFGDQLAFGVSGIRCNEGGPNSWLQPTNNWRTGGFSTITVDARQCQISHWRSTGSGASGDIHLAYRAQNGSFLAHARDADSNNAGWAIQDVATGAPGTYKDPSFYLDTANGAHIAVVTQSGATYTLLYYESTNGGVTWGTPVTAGATFTAEPTDLAISAGTILGFDVICIGYISGGQQWLRWSSDDGLNWQDQALSNGPTDEGADILIDRDTPDFFSTFSAPSGGRRDVMARHGTFVVL